MKDTVYNNGKNVMIKLSKNKKHKRKKHKNTFTIMTFSKVWVGRLLWMSVFDIQLSYILAFMGREQIAEKLAIAIVANIIFVIIPYLAKSFFETKEEEKNKLIREQMDIYKYIGNEEDDGKIEEGSER